MVTVKQKHMHTSRWAGGIHVTLFAICSLNLYLPSLRVPQLKTQTGSLSQSQVFWADVPSHVLCRPNNVCIKGPMIKIYIKWLDYRGWHGLEEQLTAVIGAERFGHFHWHLGHHSNRRLRGGDRLAWQKSQGWSATLVSPVYVYSMYISDGLQDVQQYNKPGALAAVIWKITLL